METADVQCVLQCGKPCNPATDAIGSFERWESIRQKALLLKGLDKFGSIHECVDWAKGPAGHFINDSCRLTLSNAKKLQQAQNRQRKLEVDECHSPSLSIAEVSLQDEVPAAKRLRSNLGLIHDQNKCVWCCKPEPAKHPESKLLLISYDHALAAFKSHMVALEDQKMRDRINCLIDSAADQPYALEIRYHHKCWLQYVRKFQKMSEDDKLPQMQNITFREVQTMFFDHTRKVIFEEHEIRSLQSLLRDYCTSVWVSNICCPIIIH